MTVPDFGTIPASALAVGSPVRSIDVSILYSNVLSAMGGGIDAPRLEDAALSTTVTADGYAWLNDRLPGIGASVIPDTALSQGAATAFGAAWVGKHIAIIAPGAVGSQVTAKLFAGPNAIYGFGDSAPGTYLQPSTSGGILRESSSALTGTWVCMGQAEYNSVGGIGDAATWVRTV